MLRRVRKIIAQPDLYWFAKKHNLAPHDPKLLAYNHSQVREEMYRLGYERMESLRSLCEAETNNQLKREYVREAIKIGKVLKMTRDEVIADFGVSVDVIEERVQDILEKKGFLSKADALKLLTSK